MIETRSQHRQAYNQRPAYPQLASQSSAASSTASSAFQSSSSLNSISSPNSASSQQGFLTMPQQGFASAPLPSPSSTQQPRSYFGQAPTSHPQQGMQESRLPMGQQQAYVGQRGDGSGTPETAPFLKDFNLVAEAAKRAQMACLMRDMGDVEL